MLPTLDKMAARARRRQVWKLPALYWRARSAAAYATQRGAPGLEFNCFGRRLGWQLLRRGERAALEYLLTPVSIIRYFEFPFVWNCLPEHPRRCLDLSSPRLFS